MKIILALAFIGFVITLFASEIIPFKKSKAPTLPLPVAYERAVAALGSDTNQFHCLGAQVTTDFGADGEWQFTFNSTNSRPKWVTIEFNGRVHIENIMNR